MDAVIVDTNVIAIANHEGEHASLACIESCQQRLGQVLSEREKVVVDDRWRIFGEYDRYVSGTRKWIGDIFVKTLLQNLKNPAICEMVRITPSAGNGTDFAEFPTDAALSTFDPDDRKFIAVACAYRQTSGQAATILLAIDSGWLDFVDALATHGVVIDILCEEDIQRPRQGDRGLKR